LIKIKKKLDTTHDHMVTCCNYLEKYLPIYV